ncbi:MAG: prepilin-type N-terminal cleavage/methylation domain-containing protein [Fimbriimonas sp.]
MLNRTLPKSTAKGFTLIELLVVIGIIAILAAILFPVFAQAKAAAKKSACISNVKQLSLGMVMYVGDYDDVYMPRLAGTNTVGVDHWVDLIQPYVKNKQIMRCADYVKPANRPEALSWWGYAANSHVVIPAGDGSFSATQFIDSAATAVIGDASIGDFYARPQRRTRIAWANSADTSPYNLPCESTKTRHGAGSGTKMNEGGSTIGYGDGHAKYQTASAIMYRVGIHPEGPNPGDPMFYEGSQQRICVGGPTVGP